ncbi:MAG: endonuclease/exonuclease/phosphatase family protein [Prevotellaceae bacterium]|jgi:endonuclease/exonuclease/phosphatase family metal-dependent hydrolase|nr:endonuclease/exonuclease/phosphatase family protein [Prevotellaceae bacterium]
MKEDVGKQKIDEKLLEGIEIAYTQVVINADRKHSRFNRNKILDMLKIAAYMILTALLYSCNAREERTLMSYNIRNAKGMDDVTDCRRIAGVIKSLDADVVAMQEIDSVTERSGGVFILEEIARHAGMHLSFSASIPFQGGKYGTGILSKEKPLAAKSVALPGREEKRSLLIAEFKDCTVFCTHFSLNPEDRLLSVAIINEYAEGYKKPVFLAGDMNDVPSSKVIAELQKSWTVLSDTARFTFSSDDPQICIDYIFVRKTDRVEVLNATVADERIASDHLPVYARVKCPEKQ